MFHSINPVKTSAWTKLNQHFLGISEVQMKDLFFKDPERFNKFSLRFNETLVDFSKNRITEETIQLLLQLAEECNVKDAIEAMFSGEAINQTENRAVLHTALRQPKSTKLVLDGLDVIPEVHAALDKIKIFSNQVTQGEWLGHTGKPIKHIINIGIGGSDLGPVMVTEALKNYQVYDIQAHFISNIDGTQISETLKKVNTEEVLFMIASKSFTTIETMTNAHSARQWFLKNGGTEKDISKHFVAISTNEEAVKDFGIDPKNMFIFWDWVGGRYSLWSSIGLSIACTIGYDNFEQLLEGAHEMDNHFSTASFERNIPVLLAMVGIWYTNFFNSETEAVFPYDQYLHQFSAYLQQANMESNGKNRDRLGEKINYKTGPIIWGSTGVNGQHAFFQLLHQGTRLVPCDFIAPAQSQNELGNHHDILISNFFAQTEALMNGKTKEEVETELRKNGVSEDQIKLICPFKIFDGNRPSNSILVKKITPKNLGSLIAMYEHKIFVQGVIWDIFSFDQWGVELGKTLSVKILDALKSNDAILGHDSSTTGLINTYKAMRSND